MLHTIIDFFLNLTSEMGYLGVFLLMAIESSFIPFPSEIVVPPAAYLASTGEMQLSIVILSGLAGSLLGATVNYLLGRFLGRSIVYALIEHRVSRFLLLNKKKLTKAEDYFLKYGEVSTFFGRLVPVVRQLISIPAGFVKMNYLSFILFTGLGAGLWVTILALLGFYFGENETLLRDYYVEITIVVCTLAFLVFLALIVRHFVKTYKFRSALDE